MLVFGPSTTITCGVHATPLASSATFVVGRESTVINFATSNYDDVFLSGQVTVGTTPTANTQILVFVFAPLDDIPTYPDVMDGTDSDETLTSVGVGQGFLKGPVAIMSVDSATSNRPYPFGPVALAQFFGGVGMVPKASLFVTHNTGVALNSTAGNHFFKYQGVQY